MNNEDFVAIYGELAALGFIEEQAPRRWMPTAAGARVAQKVILTILACPNDGTPAELEALSLAATTLRDLARSLEAK